MLLEIVNVIDEVVTAEKEKRQPVLTDREKMILRVWEKVSDEAGKPLTKLLDKLETK